MKELLAKYCGKNPANVHRLGVSWSAGDFTFATDGHILIRVSRIADVAGNEAAPDMLKRSGLGDMFGKEPTEWVAVPAVDYSRDTCPVCHGTALAHLCPECEGDGDVSPKTKFSTYTCECETCEGTGQISEPRWEKITKAKRFKGEPILVTCDNCNATGVNWTLDAKIVSGVKINAKFLSMIGGLPGAAIGTFGREDPVRFKFDGGEGLVMPMTPDKEDSK